MANPLDPFTKPTGTGSSDDTTIEYLSNRFAKGAKKLDESLAEALKNVSKDGSTAEDLALYQSALSAYTLYRSAQSNSVKALKDICAGTISNFR